MRLLHVLIAGVISACAAACGDPVHDNLVASLGPENPAVPIGPLHRPGQPCLACHETDGPAALAFATAGTVFQDATDATPLVGAIVQFTDATTVANGGPKVFTAETNCAGNFFIEAVDWMGVYPVHIQVNFGGQSAQMVSHMATGDSCAECHTGVISPSSVQQVYLNHDPMPYPQPSGCQ